MTLLHANHCLPEHQACSGGNNARLANVKNRQRGLAFNRGLLPACKAAVVALRLKGLVVEILHRLVIQQRVDGSGIGARIQFVHLATKVGSPFGHKKGEAHIGKERS